jgi:NTE family protein
MDETQRQIKRKKVGLALSGGAARGYAHLGALKVLVENQIPIDCIAGTSAGSIVGAALACGLSVEKIIEIGSQMHWLKIARFSYSRKGLLTNEPLGEFLKEHLPYKNFEQLPIPFAAVACDLETGDEMILKDKGDLIRAIRASCAIPGVFVPVEYEGRSLIDGGLTSLVPVKAVRQLGAEIVIAVDVNACGSSYWGTPSTFLGIFLQSAMILLRTAGRSQHYHADIVITPQVSHLRPDEMGKMNEFIKAGEIAAQEKIEEIKKILSSAQNISVS